MYLNTLDKKECCACSACEQACPKHAIQMVKDEEGFHFPQINYDLCIDCGLCEKVCPIAHPKYDNETPVSIAGYLKDKGERSKSSSGGLFYAIALYTISKGGIVYGAAFDEALQLKHIGVETIPDLEKLRGSKYVQSDMGDVLKQIKSQLIKGRLCYFVGTPCQVAGLKSFLRKEYDNLITSDLVCHGVPNQDLFNKHISYLQKKHNGIISNYAFRKNDGWGGCESFRISKNGKERTIINPSYEISPYLFGFMYNMISRYSCYECPFAKLPRQGDISLADFWGIEKYYPELDCSKGVSLILLNNSKAKQIWERVKNNCEHKESELQWAIDNNRNISLSSIKPTVRDQIYELIANKGYECIAKSLFRPKNFILKKLRNKLSILKQSLTK